MSWVWFKGIRPQLCLLNVLWRHYRHWPCWYLSNQIRATCCHHYHPIEEVPAAARWGSSGLVSHNFQLKYTHARFGYNPPEPRGVDLAMHTIPEKRQIDRKSKLSFTSSLRATVLKKIHLFHSLNNLYQPLNTCTIYV